jgi:hypothetical protein
MLLCTAPHSYVADRLELCFALPYKQAAFFIFRLTAPAAAAADIPPGCVLPDAGVCLQAGAVHLGGAPAKDPELLRARCATRF